uniref:ATP-dependent Clp protease proteolytic subunit n=1 Tax=Hedysarum xizangense TaxID=1641302 RepID=UPI002A7EC651|nr:ATP-dependent Clp protease proteolytic subunit [Hedysarum xizangense]WNM89446.1 ATP-dependent Clp protease proteolytic subunit [Hedysarum xizangense]
MPVGVPKVPFLMRGDEDTSWSDLYNVIYRTRLLFLGEEITSENSNDVIGLMIFLSVENPKRDIHMYINSPGGDMLAGLAIYDIMQFVEPAVHTLCVGTAASMASLLLIGGQITKREAFPHARIMVHQPLSGPFKESAGNTMQDVFELMKLRETVIETIIQRSGKPLEHILEALDRDSYLTPEEAQDYGIIDKIADSNSILLTKS